MGQRKLSQKDRKHGVSPKEAEQVFTDEAPIVFEDNKHSVKERRSAAIGKTQQGRTLFVVYTMRRNKIRIISARTADRKERTLYEKAKKDTTL